MAWRPPGSGELRHSVRFERRGRASNVGGVVRQDWATLIPSRRARLLPLRGGEQTQADRLGGVSAWELVVRADSETRGVTTDDRVVNRRDERQGFAIRSILDLEGRGRWLVLTLELGADDGVQG